MIESKVISAILATPDALQGGEPQWPAVNRSVKVYKPNTNRKWGKDQHMLVRSRFYPIGAHCAIYSASWS